MFDIFSDQEIQQAFFDMAHEMEKECGDWQSLPDNPELTERILTAVKERPEQKA